MFLFCNISTVWLVIMKGDMRLLILIANSKTWQEQFLNIPELQRAERKCFMFWPITARDSVAENNIKLEPGSPLSPLCLHWLWSVAASALWSVAPQVRILKLNQKHHTQPAGLIRNNMEIPVWDIKVSLFSSHRYHYHYQAIKSPGYLYEVFPLLSSVLLKTQPRH